LPKANGSFSRFDIGYKGRLRHRHVLEISTEAAIRYLKRLHSEFGNWTLALAAYNCGDSFLKRQIKKQKVKDFYRLDLPVETERYIFRIAAIKTIMENPRKYGFHLPTEHTYPPRWYDTVQVEISQRLNFTHLALALDTDFKTLKELNPQFLRDYVPRGNFKIKVPPGFGAKVVVALQELGNGRAGQRQDMSEKHYVVRKGDTLGRIAKRTGVSLATLRRINGIQGSTIWAGQKIRLTD
jgi:hypothetical protein